MSSPFQIKVIESPLGQFALTASNDALLAAGWTDEEATLPNLDTSSAGVIASPLLKEAAKQFSAYFDGKLRDFDLPTKPLGTDFERHVWRTLLNIEWGRTRSYLDIARELGNPDAVRAVGGANGKNPIAIMYPCHRVIGSDGSLTGYAGGVQRKSWLLQHESIRQGVLF
ncbi:MAG: methylated-DNA-[protein]-cysteine S-methyltransferase [Limisphaerales bacterium]|jgi:methylated-DNA-[protein]-cysteine S-methyltransferase